MSIVHQVIQLIARTSENSILYFQGRFTDETEKSPEREINDLSTVHDRRTPIPSNQYYTIPSNHEEQTDESSIKSASYMDELRQRLERVLNDPLPPMKESMSRPATLISPPPPPKFKPIKSSTDNLHQLKMNSSMKSPTMSIGSTPLPRKQMDNSSHFSYRTINRHSSQQQQSMSKSFIIPSKQEGRFYGGRHSSSKIRLFRSSKFKFIIDNFNLRLSASFSSTTTFNISPAKNSTLQFVKIEINCSYSSDDFKTNIITLEKTLHIISCSFILGNSISINDALSSSVKASQSTNSSTCPTT